MDKWIQITPNDAFLYCERAGFKTKEIDFFEMDIKEFYLPNTKISFKYRIQNSDPMRFYILPTIDNKPVDYETFKNAVLKAKENT